MRLFTFIILLVCSAAFQQICAQDSPRQSRLPLDSSFHAKKDSAGVASIKQDSTKKKQAFNPTRATIYSAIFPGLGQIYNKKYWKLPIVWAAVGIPTYTYFDNKNWYNKTRYALAVLANGSYYNKDSISRVDPKLLPFIFNPDSTLNSYGVTGLEKYRNYFRSNEDYSVLFFLLFYALNIVDATVDAHLKLFDVSRDLTIRIAPCSSNISGISLVFDLHKPQFKFYNTSN
jgi:hypothetical protein